MAAAARLRQPRSTPLDPHLIVKPVAWAQASAQCLLVRRAVFIQEQGIDPAIEIDGRDPECAHVLAWYKGDPVGTARLLPDGHVGRVAVLKPYRGRGLGARLMTELLAMARSQGHASVHLASQASAVAFYLKLGFAPEGGPFLEAGIPHQNMVLTL